MKRASDVSTVWLVSVHISRAWWSRPRGQKIVALDGCQVACAKKTIEHAGLTVTDWICVTEEGISKNHEFQLGPEDIDSYCPTHQGIAGKAAGSRQMIEYKDSPFRLCAQLGPKPDG